MTGPDAQRIKDDPVFRELMALIRGDIKDAWANTRPDDTAKREGFWQQLQAVARIEGRIESIVLDGKIRENRNG